MKPLYQKLDISEYEKAVGGCCVPQSYMGDGSIIAGRPDFTREDYDDWRPSEKIPTSHKSILLSCNEIYRKVGIVKNMIDLMSDFGCNGISLVHPNKRIEKFYQNWFKRVNGVDRSERFLNSLYKLGNTVIRRQTSFLKLKDSKQLYKTVSSDSQIEYKHIDVKRRTIPIRYTFLNPYTVKLVGTQAAVFANKKRYSIQIPVTLSEYSGNSTLSKEHYSILNELPTEIKNAVEKGNEYPLDPNNTLIFHYKKDDWQEWADPLIYSVLEDINIIRKMKLADASVLDGAINKTIIYKLGSLEHGFAPTEAGFNRLSELLKTNSLGNTKEIIWGPDIEVINISNDMYRFLGNEKYVPHMAAIYNGLGVPPILTGTGDGSGANNLISLNALIERLEYGRQRLVEFWEQEIEIVRQAMDFTDGAHIQFSISNLGDREAERKLFIELAERDIISDEFVQQKFGANPIIETARQKRENKERTSKKRPHKASPFHNANFEEDIEKLAYIANLKQPTKTTKKTNTIVGVEGRPKNSKDTTPRKSRQFSSARVWIADIYDKLSNEVSSAFLKHVEKKNIRSLSSEEFQILEKLKIGSLMNIELFTKDEKFVQKAMSSPIDYSKIEACFEEVSVVESELGRHLTVAEKRDVYLDYYLWCKDF